MRPVFVQAWSHWRPAAGALDAGLLPVDQRRAAGPATRMAAHVVAAVLASGFRPRVAIFGGHAGAGEPPARPEHVLAPHLADLGERMTVDGGDHTVGMSLWVAVERAMAGHPVLVVWTEARPGQELAVALGLGPELGSHHLSLPLRQGAAGISLPSSAHPLGGALRLVEALAGPGDHRVRLDPDDALHPAWCIDVCPVRASGPASEGLGVDPLSGDTAP